MRLIDADRLKDTIHNITFVFDGEDDGHKKHDISKLCHHILSGIIDDAPTMDAVEVVRRKPVKGYEGYYEVDMYGNVYSIERVVRVNDNGREYDKPVKAKRLSHINHTKGYKTVSLTRDGVTKMCYVHRIVAEAYIPNPQGLPLINHKDEDKTNNFVGNLEWCTEQYNSTYGSAREKHANAIKGRPLSEEHKRKISETNKKTWAEKHGR